MLKNLQEITNGGAEHALHRLWSDQLTEPEAAAIQARAAGDPKYRDDLDGLLAVFDSIEGLEGDRAVEDVIRDYPRLRDKRRSKVRVTLGMAAALLVAVSATLTHFSISRGPDDGHLQEYFTRVGEQQTIELDDGSVVTLNTAGQLVVDYSGPMRRIVLKRGEAYFEVAEVPDRPFTVDLGLRSVTAVGTEFVVRKDPRHYQVAVIEGVVAIGEFADGAYAPPPRASVDGEAVILPTSAQHRLEAGWVAEFDVERNELKAFRPQSLDHYAGWRSGMITFTREPLSQVIQELNRYTRKQVLIEDEAVMDLSVYVIVNVREIDAALDGLEGLLPIKVTRHYDRIVITGSGEDEP
ncbi:MAG: FecR domain-containing protein [Gammaproteobacteria bacterium]|nr:FecR domain-containing protein [Gammaproteobacteria bacterium]